MPATTSFPTVDHQDPAGQCCFQTRRKSFQLTRLCRTLRTSLSGAPPSPKEGPRFPPSRHTKPSHAPIAEGHGIGCDARHTGARLRATGSAQLPPLLRRGYRDAAARPTTDQSDLRANRENLGKDSKGPAGTVWFGSRAVVRLSDRLHSILGSCA